MKLYAETPARLTRQLIADGLVLCWVYAWTQVGFTVRDLVLSLAAPGRRMQEAGGDVADAAAQTSESLAQVPLVGEQLASPFQAIADAAIGLAAAGVAQQEAVSRTATTLGVVTAIAPILIVAALWLWLRWRWIREASAAARLRDAGAGNQLFALRALVQMPLTKVRAVAGDDPYAALQDGRSAQLARMHLRALGLRER